MLILDKQMAVERMVAIATRPDVPDQFRRSHTLAADMVIEAQGDDGAAQRKLGRELVLAGYRRMTEAQAPEPSTQQAARVLAGKPASDVRYIPAELVPELHPEHAGEPDVATQRPGFLRRVWRSLTARHGESPPSSPRPYRRDAGCVRMWHPHPVDGS